jgi:hypothetical protein
MEKNILVNTTIQKKRVLVFDTSKGYSRLIYRFFGNSFEIIQCANSKNLYSYNKLDFDCALVIINHKEDVLNLSYIHSKVNTVFLGSRIKDFDHSLYKMDGIIYLDLFDRKTVFLKYMIIKLKELKLLHNVSNQPTTEEKK